MVVKTKFNRWLFNQTDFDDYSPLADLARDASEDPKWPAVRELDDMLEYWPRIPADNPRGVQDAMVTAWCQWRFEDTGLTIKMDELIFACQMEMAVFEEDEEEDGEELAAWRSWKQRLIEGEQISMETILGREELE